MEQVVVGYMIASVCRCTDPSGMGLMLPYCSRANSLLTSCPRRPRVSERREKQQVFSFCFSADVIQAFCFLLERALYPKMLRLPTGPSFNCNLLVSILYSLLFLLFILFAPRITDFIFHVFTTQFSRFLRL